MSPIPINLFRLLFKRACTGNNTNTNTNINTKPKPNSQFSIQSLTNSLIESLSNQTNSIQFTSMSLSFTISSKSQTNRHKKAFSDNQPIANPSKNFVNEFDPNSTEPKIKPIAPIPDQWQPTKKLKNLQTLPPLSQPNTGPHFEIHDEKPDENSMAYGLNIRSLDSNSGDHVQIRHESIADMELRKLREDLDKLPDDTGMGEFEDVPVEGFGAALLLGYGWKEGSGIGRNAKEDVKIKEGVRKAGRGGLGFTDDFPEDSVVVVNENKTNKKKNDNVNRSLRVGKEVRILHGREMGIKGKVVEVRSDGDLLLVRLSKSDVRVKVRSRDVAEVGSVEEDKFLRKLKELKVKEKDVVSKDKRDRNGPSKTGVEKGRARGDRVNWLRNHIRVRIVSKELKGGKLFLKKGMIVDVVGPGVCDISMDESRELIQGVDQDLLETALPKRGGPVLVLSGRHKGVYGNLLERDTENEKGVVRDADTHELLNVKLEEIAEFTGDPSDIGY